VKNIRLHHVFAGQSPTSQTHSIFLSNQAKDTPEKKKKKKKKGKEKKELLLVRAKPVDEIKENKHSWTYPTSARHLAYVIFSKAIK
jgi:hypothetical protein